MVFCQLLSLALLGTASAQCAGYRVYMSESLTDQNEQPAYFQCKDMFSFYASQDVVTYYYTYASTNVSDPRVRVYAKVPSMPPGNNSYGAFGVQHANHSDLYMWGRQHNGVVKQEWEVIKMSRSAGGTHTFTPSNVNEVTFSQPAAERYAANNQLEIMFTLPSEPANYNFTAAVGEYGSNPGHGRILSHHMGRNKAGASSKRAPQMPRSRAVIHREYCTKPRNMPYLHVMMGVGEETLERANFRVTLSCTTGYSGDLTAEVCAKSEDPFIISGVCKPDAKNLGDACGNAQGEPFPCVTTASCLVTHSNEECSHNVSEPNTCTCVAAKNLGYTCGNAQGKPFPCATTTSCLVTLNNEECGHNVSNPNTCTCVPPHCTRPDDFDSLHANLSGFENVNIATFNVNLLCATGYSGKLTATGCNTTGAAYTISGVCKPDEKAVGSTEKKTGNTIVITAACLGAVAAFMVAIGSIHLWRNRAQRLAARRLNAGPGDLPSEVSNPISVNDKKKDNPVCESASTSLV